VGGYLTCKVFGVCGEAGGLSVCMVVSGCDVEYGRFWCWGGVWRGCAGLRGGSFYEGCGVFVLLSLGRLVLVLLSDFRGGGDVFCGFVLLVWGGRRYV